MKDVRIPYVDDIVGDNPNSGVGLGEEVEVVEKELTVT